MIRRSLLLICIILLSGCASLVGPRDVDIPLSKLQNQLNQRFPVNNRYLEVFDISLGQPRLSLKPDQNRIQFDFDVVIAPPLTSKRIAANLSLSGGLRVDNVRKGLMLTDPRVEKLHVDGIDPVYNRQFSKLGTFVADRFFMENPVHRFKDDDLKAAGVQFVATAITVREQSVVISVEPAK